MRLSRLGWRVGRPPPVEITNPLASFNSATTSCSSLRNASSPSSSKICAIRFFALASTLGESVTEGRGEGEETLVEDQQLLEHPPTHVGGREQLLDRGEREHQTDEDPPVRGERAGAVVQYAAERLARFGARHVPEVGAATAGDGRTRGRLRRRVAGRAANRRHRYDSLPCSSDSSSDRAAG